MLLELQNYKLKSEMYNSLAGFRMEHWLIKYGVQLMPYRKTLGQENPKIDLMEKQNSLSSHFDKN